MDVPDEVRRDAERTGELVRKKLLEIMELQADIDTLLRGDQPTPFGSITAGSNALGLVGITPVDGTARAGMGSLARATRGLGEDCATDGAGDVV